MEGEDEVSVGYTKLATTASSLPACRRWSSPPSHCFTLSQHVAASVAKSKQELATSTFCPGRFKHKAAGRLSVSLSQHHHQQTSRAGEIGHRQSISAQLLAPAASPHSYASPEPAHLVSGRPNQSYATVLPRGRPEHRRAHLTMASHLRLPSLPSLICFVLVLAPRSSLA